MLQGKIGFEKDERKLKGGKEGARGEEKKGEIGET